MTKSTVEIANLKGADLDKAVAMALGMEYSEDWKPGTDDDDCKPLIQRFWPHMSKDGEKFVARFPSYRAEGDTYNEAAMRLIAIAHLGKTISL